MDHLDEYQLVGSDPEAKMPPRSALASLRPMGLGTPYRESLSSYYLQLAHMHHFSPKSLARGLIVPRIKVGSERGTEDSFHLWKLSLFNGIGVVPETWSKHLNDLTGRTDLMDLTLVPLRPYTHRQRLMRSDKRWCPLCLSEAAQEGRAYGQLLWEIAAVEACPKHGIKLVGQCSCGGLSPTSRQYFKYLSGYCNSCGRSLSQKFDELITTASEDEVKRSRLVAELLGDMVRIKEQTSSAKSCISTFFRDAAFRFAGGNAALLGRMLGVRKNTLHGWLHGRFVPTFPELVEITVLCGCSIADVIFEKLTTSNNSVLTERTVPQRRSFRKNIAKLDRELTRRNLEELATEDPPISVSTAAQRIGVDRRTLFSHFGGIAQKMTGRVQELKAYEKTVRFEKKCNLYHQSAVRLIEQGIRPTQRSIALNFNGISIVGSKERKACDRICREVIQLSNNKKKESIYGCTIKSLQKGALTS